MKVGDRSSESELDESSISSSSVTEARSFDLFSFGEARRDRDLDCASGAGDASTSVSCFDLDVSFRLAGLDFGDTGRL